MVLKDENLCHIWKFTINDFFFELLSGRDSKTVNLLAWYLGIVCSSKRYSSWINQEKPRFRNLVKKNLIYGCFFSCLREGCWCPFFDLLENHIIVSYDRYWFEMLDQHLETGA